MQQQLTCSQVGALLTFYIENRLNEQLRKYVEYHLSICPSCMEKYKKLTKLVSNYNEVKKQIESDNLEDEKIYYTQQYQEFRENLSAYIDNELDTEENLRIKKIAISNPLARRDLEDIYTFKKLLHSSFDKTKNDVHQDFSRQILSKVFSINPSQKPDPFYILMTTFVVIIGMVILGMASILF